MYNPSCLHTNHYVTFTVDCTQYYCLVDTIIYILDI